MAKKNRSIKKKAANARVDESENRLPQNIIGIGERVEEDKNIYISQPVYKLIHRFTRGKTTNESGGILIGNIIEKFHKTNILISGFVEAKFCEATPTTLKFTHETWEYLHKEIDKKYPGKKIVGWIHTHPDFGIFLSEYDKFIQENFFREEYDVAFVVDPIQGIEGFYFWINGKIERCKGFYIYDKIGVRIDTDISNEENTTHEMRQSGIWLNRIVMIALFVAVLMLTVSVIKLNGKIDVLQNQQENSGASVNQSISSMQQQILFLQDRINELTVSEEPDNIKNSESGKSVNPPIQTDVDASGLDSSEEKTP